MIGFGRQVVFAHTVQAQCLGTAYTTANMVPNIIYDIVMGGALTAVVVPVLAGPASALGADRKQVRQTSAALLTWTVLLLVPLSAVVALAARPVVSALLGATPGCPRATMVVAGRADAHRVRPADPALRAGRGAVRHPPVAPQVRRPRAGPGGVQPGRDRRLPLVRPIADSSQFLRRPVPTAAWIVLAVGTTAGVAALVATPLVPAARLRLRLRPTLKFPPGVGARVRSLAAAGFVTIIAQDISVAVVIVLANSRGGGGTLVLYSFAWAVFFVPYAVLSVPDRDQRLPGDGRARRLLRRHRGQLDPGRDGGLLAGRGRHGRRLRAAGPGLPVSRRPRPPTPGSWPSRWSPSRPGSSATA